MKYTRSKDGTYRMSLHASIRVEKSEVANLRAAAKHYGGSLREFLDYCLKRGIWDELDSQESEREYLA